MAVFVGGCGGDEVTNPEPPIEGEPLYGVHPGLCFDPCWDWELHALSPSVVELRAYDRDSGYVGLSRADLKPETAEQLAELRAEALAIVDTVPDGTSDDCRWVPETFVNLWIGERELGYGARCPQPELAALDELLFAITGELTNCDVTPRISPQIGCEPLSPWAELYEN